VDGDEEKGMTGIPRSINSEMSSRLVLLWSLLPPPPTTTGRMLSMAEMTELGRRTVDLLRRREEREEWNLAGWNRRTTEQEEEEPMDREEEKEHGSDAAEELEDTVEEKEEDLDLLLCSSTTSSSFLLSSRSVSGSNAAPKKCSSFRCRRFRLLSPPPLPSGTFTVGNAVAAGVLLLPSLPGLLRSC
jgi:hypothetical protein